MKTQLKRIFLEGGETGRKASAADVRRKMRTQRDDRGRKIFTKEEWLAGNQIAGYFSRLCVLCKCGRLAVQNASPDSTENEGSTLSRRQNRSPRSLKYKDNWNCDHTIYSNQTGAIHRLYHFFARPVVQKFRLGYPWDSTEYRDQRICEKTAIGFTNTFS